jgi:hypothetical protein
LHESYTNARGGLEPCQLSAQLPECVPAARGAVDDDHGAAKGGGDEKRDEQDGEHFEYPSFGPAQAG